MGGGRGFVDPFNLMRLDHPQAWIPGRSGNGGRTDRFSFLRAGRLNFELGSGYSFAELAKEC